MNIVISKSGRIKYIPRENNVVEVGLKLNRTISDSADTINQNFVHHLNGKDEKILIIGLGQIGYSNAEYMKKIGIKVDGYDIMEKAVQRALDAGVIQNSATDFKGYDYYLICISTHKPENMFMPYLDGLFEVARKLSVEGTPGALVGIDSTITRGTSRKVLEILKHRLHVVHVPHRYYIHEAEEHGVRQMRVIGGCEPCCTNEALHFYKDVLDIPLHKVNPIEIAEITKVVENSYRFMEIAFAEELKMVCDKINIDFSELRKAVNTKWNTKIMEPRDGIGGHCLPKDSQMFLDFAKGTVQHSLLEAAKMIDYKYRSHIHQIQPFAIGLENTATKSTVQVPAEIFSSLKEEYNMTEVQIQSILGALVNKLVKDHPDVMHAIINPKTISQD